MINDFNLLLYWKLSAAFSDWFTIKKTISKMEIPTSRRQYRDRNLVSSFHPFFIKMQEPLPLLLLIKAIGFCFVVSFQEREEMALWQICVRGREPGPEIWQSHKPQGRDLPSLRNVWIMSRSFPPRSFLLGSALPGSCLGTPFKSPCLSPCLSFQFWRHGGGWG